MAAWTAALLATLAAPLVALGQARPDSYYGLVQEDGPIEWATFWLLLAGAAVFAFRALRAAGVRSLAPAGLALASAFLAGEEISWGQRVLGYRPPELFLAANAQQEANLHNLAGAGARQLAVDLALVALGALLPLALRWRPLRAWAESVGLASPLACAPLLLGALALQLVHPVPFTGEIVELLVGAALLVYAGLWLVPRERAVRAIGLTTLAVAGCIALGAGSAHASRLRAADPRAIAAAEREVRALAEDLLLGARAAGHAPTGCGLHTRMASLARERAGRGLRWSRFSSSAGDSSARERTAHFLDPWSSSYWVRDYCAGGARSVFVYSFGPNRRRDSGESALAGDDIGAYLVVRESPPQE
jgi:hypothetical protein